MNLKEINKMKVHPKRRSENIVVQDLNDEVLVYDLDRNKAVCLNETAMIVWNLCDGGKPISGIAREAGKKLNKPVTDELIWLAIDQLKRENLLSNGEAVEPDFNGLARREVIKKTGIAAMVALPIVTSILAPQALAAQSVCVASGTCIQAGQDVCAGCIGTPLTGTFYQSTDGSCTTGLGFWNTPCNVVSIFAQDRSIT